MTDKSSYNKRLQELEKEVKSWQLKFGNLYRYGYTQKCNGDFFEKRAVALDTELEKCRSDLDKSRLEVEEVRKKWKSEIDEIKLRYEREHSYCMQLRDRLVDERKYYEKLLLEQITVTVVTPGTDKQAVNVQLAETKVKLDSFERTVSQLRQKFESMEASRLDIVDGDDDELDKTIASLKINIDSFSKIASDMEKELAEKQAKKVRKPPKDGDQQNPLAPTKS